MKTKGNVLRSKDHAGTDDDDTDAQEDFDPRKRSVKEDDFFHAGYPGSWEEDYCTDEEESDYRD